MMAKIAIVGVAAFVAYRLYTRASALPQATSAGVRIAGGDPQLQPSGGGAVVPTSRGTSLTGWILGGDTGPSEGRIGLAAPHGQDGSFAGLPQPRLRTSADPPQVRTKAAPNGWASTAAAPTSWGARAFGTARGRGTF